MELKKKIPEIRYSRFIDEWRKVSFDDFFDLTVSHNSLSRSELSLEKSEVKNIHYGDILVKYSTIVNVALDEIPYIINGISDKYNMQLLDEGDIVMADAAEDDIVGKVIEITNIQKRNIVAGLHTIVCRPKFDIKQFYLGYYMNSNSYHNQLLHLMQGTKVLSVNKSSLSKTYIISPNEPEEQQKIGQYFKNLDNLITLQQQKYDKLVTIKKTLLDKMFPKKDERVPEIRFDGFSGEWRKHAIGEIMDVTSVKRIHQADWENSGIRFLRARDIISLAKGEVPADLLFISEKKYLEYSLLSGKVQKGDLLVTGVGTIGVPMLIENSNPIYFKDGNIIWFKNNNIIDGCFFYYSFLCPFIQRFIKKSAGIGTVGTYTIESGKSTPVLIPKSSEEQQKVGIYFKKLNNLLRLQNQKLEKLKSIKKALLDRMFV